MQVFTANTEEKNTWRTLITGFSLSLRDVGLMSFKRTYVPLWPSSSAGSDVLIEGGLGQMEWLDAAQQRAHSRSYVSHSICPWWDLEERLQGTKACQTCEVNCDPQSEVSWGRIFCGTEN